MGTALPALMVPELGLYGTGLHCDVTRNNAVRLLSLVATTGGGSQIKCLIELLA
jgi:hypothetical protein